MQSIDVLRLVMYILVVAAVFAPLVASANIVLPRPFSATTYFAALVALAFVCSAVACGMRRIAWPKVGSLTFAISMWAVAAAAIGRDFMPLTFAALFLTLQALMLHEEEWIRLLRMFVVVGALLTWPAFLGSAGRIFLQMYATFFVPMLFLALVFARREKTRLSRLWFWGVALLFASVLFYAYADMAGEFRFLRALWIVKASRQFASPEGITVATAVALVWIAAFWTVGKIARRKTATPVWIAGLSGAFAAQLVVDPLLSAWFGSTLAFVVLAALAEWVAQSAQP